MIVHRLVERRTLGFRKPQRSDNDSILIPRALELMSSWGPGYLAVFMGFRISPKRTRGGIATKHKEVKPNLRFRARALTKAFSLHSEAVYCLGGRRERRNLFIKGIVRRTKLNNANRLYRAQERCLRKGATFEMPLSRRLALRSRFPRTSMRK